MDKRKKSHKGGERASHLRRLWGEKLKRKGWFPRPRRLGEFVSDVHFEDIERILRKLVVISWGEKVKVQPAHLLRVDGCDW